jgi:1,6-anhydro-N-acetylmuramate kinase
MADLFIGLMSGTRMDADDAGLVDFSSGEAASTTRL